MTMVRLKMLALFALVMALTMAFGINAWAQSKIELEFPSWQATEPGFSQWWNEVIAEFETAYPNVKVNFYQVSGTSRLVDQLIVRFAANDPPDIIHLPTRNARTFIDRGWLAPVDEYLKGTGFPEQWTSLQEILVQDGENYGVLLLGFAYLLFYNEQHLEEAQIGVPTTLDELIRAAKALTRDTDGDGQIDQFGLAMSTATHSATYNELTRFIIAQGGHWTRGGRLDVKSEAVRSGIQTLRELVQSGVSPLGLDDTARRVPFIEGRASLILDGPWLLPLIRQNSPADVQQHIKVVPSPFEYTSGGVSNSIHMPARLDPERKRLVAEFMKLIVSPKWQIRYAELTASPSPRAVQLSDAALATYPELQLFTSEAQKAVSLIPAGVEAHYTEFEKYVIDAISELIGFDRSPDEVLDNLERQLQSRLR